MSVSERTIKAFIQVIEEESTLFSLEDWEDLHKLSSTLPEDTEEISTIIRSWLKLEQRQQIKEAFENQRRNIPSSFSFSKKHLGTGGSKSPTPPDQPSESSKELLDGSISVFEVAQTDNNPLR